MRREVLNGLQLAYMGVLVQVAFHSFSKTTKEDAWQNADQSCEMCGAHIDKPGGTHHRVPQKALKDLGIRGTDHPVNAASLCNEGADCHEVADQKAIHERLFWNGQEFVPLEQMPPETYKLVEPRLPKTRRSKRTDDY